MTTRELAIVRTVVYAALFDYPLTLEQLHQTLIESDQSPSEILAVYDGSEPLHTMVEYRDGFFFPRGRADLIAERRRREARGRRFLQQHERMLQLMCAVPFTRLIALSGSIAHLNLEAGGDLDLFVITRGRRVWTVTVALLVLAKLLRRRRVVCANFVLADSHLGLDQDDLFTANQVLHLKPLIGEAVFESFVAANPFVGRFYPNRAARLPRLLDVKPQPWGRRALKAMLECVLWAPSPLIELACRRLYAWHLRRRQRSWRSPDQVRLQSDCLKLHTKSHRHDVLDRFDRAMEQALHRGVAEPARRMAAAGRR
jgi:hypothetical protein